MPQDAVRPALILRHDLPRKISPAVDIERKMGTSIGKKQKRRSSPIRPQFGRTYAVGFPVGKADL
jgi:hypothetical protein